MENILPANAENVADSTALVDTEVSEAEFSDTEATEVAEEVPTETLAERNRKAYEMRQARKQSKAKAVSEEKKEVKKDKPLVNTYTGQPIETDEDMEDFKLMQTIEDEGGDAILDFPEYLRNKRKKVAEDTAPKQQAKNESNDFLMQELDSQLGDIKQTLGVDAEDLYAKNKAFRDFANEMIDDGAPLKSIVKTWQKFETKNNAEIERRARDLLNKGSAIPPIKSATPPTVKTVSEMTNKEFEEYKRQVKMGEI